MFNKFPSIESFHHIRRFAMKYPEHVPASVEYRGKVKLHGTNAGVTVTSDGAIAQSRSRVITVEDDNAGFAKWVASSEDFFISLHRGEDFTIFGEWAGPGIQKGVACAQVPSKFFAVFMVQYGAGEDARVVAEPGDICALIGDGSPDSVFVLPWETDQIPTNFFDRLDCERTADLLNTYVLRVEQEDPFIKRNFGISGTGEGLVFYPVGVANRTHLSNLMFKAKGEEHKVVKAPRAVEIDPQVAASVASFVDMFVTEARCQQGLTEACGGDADMRQIGAFLKWMGQDIEKESVAELESSGLEWKAVTKGIQAAAKQWFIGRSKMAEAA